MLKFVFGDAAVYLIEKQEQTHGKMKIYCMVLDIILN